MGEDIFRERAYKILYEKYESIHFKVVQAARANKGSEDLQRLQELLTDITEETKYPHWGFAKEEDLVVINALEYCLGIRDSLD